MASLQTSSGIFDHPTDRRRIAHDINDRLNTIALGITLLEQSNDPDVQRIVSAINSQFNELKGLVRDLRNAE